MSGYLPLEQGVQNKVPPDGKAHNTGDVFEFPGNGLLRFSGRVDRALRVQGQRVELDGLEAWVESRPEIRDAVALALDANRHHHRDGAAVVRDQRALEHG